jgi:EmrB/QacA subfamily drug resistance transporter
MPEYPPASTNDAPPAHDRSRWLALGVLCAGLLMIILDSTIVNVALPTIERDLGFTQSGLAWVVNGYLIGFGGLLLLSGRLGDLVGRRHVFVAGLTIFTTASLLCGISTTPVMLIVARFVQGVGGSLTSAVALGMIVTLFPNGRERSKAIAVFSAVAAGGGAIGLVAGGLITQAISWHWIFFVNLPIGAAAIVMARRLLPNDRGLGLRAGADGIGALLVTGSLMLGVYTIVAAADYGWISLHTLGLGAIALTMLVAFLVRQTRVTNPLLPLRVFRSRNMSGANATSMLVVAGLFGFQFIGALYLQRVLHYDAVQTGLAILPTAIVVGAISLGFSARMNTRFGPKAVAVPALVLVVAGLALLARAPIGANYAIDLLPVMLLLGTGIGLAMPALTTLAMSSATSDDAGLASGLVNTTQQIGGALGLAVLATIAASRTATLEAAGTPEVEALTGGYHLAIGISAVLTLLAVVVAAIVLVPEPIGEYASPAEMEAAALLRESLASEPS